MNYNFISRPSLIKALRILWFNWRDIKHPEAGGSEVLTHELMRRFVLRGYKMTLFCGRVEGRPREEDIDGVNIVRDGGKYTVYGRGRSYFKKNRDRFDFVIDEVNPRPFLDPKKLAGKPALVLFHQMIREEWFYELPFLFSHFCNFYENRWLLPYRQTPTLTVSQSSKKDLESIGFKNVKVIPMGISNEPLSRLSQKEDSPTVVFIGRLKRHKLPDHAIKAFQIIKEEIPTAKMWVIGDGYMLSELTKLRNRDIKFFGHVENRVKYQLLSRAHLTLVPSVREGWGLVVTESNAMGTPVVAYDVNGLRDSVLDGRNGVLVKGKDPESLATYTVKILSDKDMLNRLSVSALEHSRQFSWDKTFDYFSAQIHNVI
jgi:glycosyltransferase involved in cell wall biosynthesis